MSSLRGLLPQRSTSYAGRVATISGTFISTLDDCTSSTAGTVTASGTFVATLANVTSNTIGEVEAAITGVMTATMGNVTSLTAGEIDEGELELPMASRIVDILTRVRDTLADPNKERWSDERLLRLLDEAQKDVAKQSQILKGTYEFSLAIGEPQYTLPDDIWLITRASYDDTDIELISYDKLDELAKKQYTRTGPKDYSRNRRIDFLDSRLSWEDNEGSAIEALVFDNRNVNEIRTYPIPNEAIAEASYTFQNSGYLETTETDFSSVYGILTGVPTTDSLIDELGVVVDADSILYLITDPNSCNGASIVDDVLFNSVYGLTADIEDNLKTVGFKGDELLGVTVSIDDYSSDSVYGLAGDLYDPAIQTESFNSVYGVITSVTESQKSVKLWYIKIPDQLTSLSSTLQTPRMFDVALKHFVVGHALRDDLDVQYREMGLESLSLYDRDLQIASNTNSSDGTRNAVNHTSTYRGGFN